jgi:hypothetical protein
MYITDAYARIQCNECGNKLVDTLIPGKPFESIKSCTCQAPKVVKKRTVKVKDVELRTDKQ